MSLPVPKDPNYSPKVSEKEFYDLDAPEDEALLASGQFDNYDEDDTAAELSEAAFRVLAKALKKK